MSADTFLVLDDRRFEVDGWGRNNANNLNPGSGIERIDSPISKSIVVVINATNLTGLDTMFLMKAYIKSDRISSGKLIFIKTNKNPGAYCEFEGIRILSIIQSKSEYDRKKQIQLKTKSLNSVKLFVVIICLTKLVKQPMVISKF